MNLYELTDELIQLQDMMSEECEEQVLLDTIEAVEGEFDAKIEGYCKVIKNLEADAKALKEEAKRLSARQKSIENNISRMKNAMTEALRQTGKKEAGGLLKAKIQKNGGMLPLIVTEPSESLPDAFRKVSYEADNDAIRKALDEGQELRFASYGERGESLRIK